MKNIKDSDALTVGIFKALVEEIIIPKFVALESKMMEGFDALDRKIDFVEGESERRDRELHKELSDKMDKSSQESEHRDRALSAQIQHLAFTKADWNEIS